MRKQDEEWQDEEWIDDDVYCKPKPRPIGRMAKLEADIAELKQMLKDKEEQLCDCEAKLQIATSALAWRSNERKLI